MSDEDLFYVVSLKHTLRNHLYITVWRPDDKGYCWALCNAGRYSRERVMAHLGYYNGGANVAVPCMLLDAIAIPPKPGHHDNDTGPVIANNRLNWKLIAEHVIEPPKERMWPQFKGSPKGPYN